MITHSQNHRNLLSDTLTNIFLYLPYSGILPPLMLLQTLHLIITYILRSSDVAIFEKFRDMIWLFFDQRVEFKKDHSTQKILVVIRILVFRFPFSTPTYTLSVVLFLCLVGTGPEVPRLLRGY